MEVCSFFLLRSGELIAFGFTIMQSKAISVEKACNVAMFLIKTHVHERIITDLKILKIINNIGYEQVFHYEVYKLWLLSNVAGKD